VLSVWGCCGAWNSLVSAPWLVQVLGQVPLTGDEYL
jgi:hypothetical protein